MLRAVDHPPQPQHRLQVVEEPQPAHPQLLLPQQQRLAPTCVPADNNGKMTTTRGVLGIGLLEDVPYMGTTQRQTDTRRTMHAATVAAVVTTTTSSHQRRRRRCRRRRQPPPQR